MQERGPVTALSEGRRSSLALAVVVAAAVVAADQLTTSWALADLHGRVHLLGPLGLALQFNSGTAFGLAPGAGPWVVPVVLLVCVLLVWLAWHGASTVLSVAYGLLLGGALGNVADRLLRARDGKVVDFVTLSHWPTFNVSDACITAGALVLVVSLVLGGRRSSGGGREPARAPRARGGAARAEDRE